MDQHAECGNFASDPFAPTLALRIGIENPKGSANQGSNAVQVLGLEDGICILAYLYEFKACSVIIHYPASHPASPFTCARLLNELTRILLRNQWGFGCETKKVLASIK